MQSGHGFIETVYCTVRGVLAQYVTMSVMNYKDTDTKHELYHTTKSKDPNYSPQLPLAYTYVHNQQTLSREGGKTTVLAFFNRKDL